MSKKDSGIYVDPRYAGRKDDGYGNVIADIIKNGCCPFCPEYFKWHQKPILKKAGGWFITESSWPYENAEHHYLIIPERHIEHVTELEKDDLSTVLDLVNEVVKKNNILGGGIALRFGDTRYTGATVVHLHFHLIVPHKEDAKDASETVYFPFG